MGERFTLRIDDWITLPERKRTLNLHLFKEIAPWYDIVTKALSLGRDKAWKRTLVDFLPRDSAPMCVDLACGTGDITLLLAGRYRRGKIHGVDLTPQMLERAAQLASAENIHYSRQDMCMLNFPNACIDIVTGGYALRNAPDLDQALEEVSRVLKPGGIAGFLDFSKPKDRLIQRLEYSMLRIWGGFWGLLLHGNPAVYIYIAESLKRFPDRQKLREKFRSHNFELLQSQRFYFGIIEILIVKKKI